jgi:hypothetical protein
MASSASAALMATERGITLVSNRGRRLAAPRGGEEGGSGGRAWGGGEPSSVGCDPRPGGVLLPDEPEGPPPSDTDVEVARTYRGGERGLLQRCARWPSLW